MTVASRRSAFSTVQILSIIIHVVQINDLRLIWPVRPFNFRKIIIILTKYLKGFEKGFLCTSSVTMNIISYFTYLPETESEELRNPHKSLSAVLFMNINLNKMWYCNIFSVHGSKQEKGTEMRKLQMHITRNEDLIYYNFIHNCYLHELWYSL